MPISISGEEITIDLTNRSFTDLQTDAIDLANQLFPEWDTNDYDPAIVLLDYEARLGAGLFFMVDRRAEEAYPATLRLKQSLSRIGKTFGYDYNRGSTASVNITVTTNAAGTIPKYLAVGNNPTPVDPSLRYELLEDYTAPAAGSFVLTFHQGTVYEDEILGTSSGKPEQSFTIFRTPISITNGNPYVVVEVYEGTAWYQWELKGDFLNSSDTSRHFVTEFLETGELKITFGDNIKGKIPPQGNSNIRVTYRVGRGTDGNKPAPNTITTILDNKGSTIIDSVINLTRPSGGANEKSLVDAKKEFPAVVAANDRVIIYDDAVALLASAGIGISKALAYRGNGPYEFVTVIAAEGSNPIPTGYWNPYLEVGEGIIGAAGAYLLDKLGGGYILNIKPAVPVYVITEINTLVNNRAYRSSVRIALSSNLSTFLSPATYTFGQTVKLNELAQLVENTVGVNNSDSIVFYRLPRARLTSGTDVALFTEYAVSNNITEQDWLIEYTGTNTFKVTGSVTGLQINTGTSGTLYKTDNNALQFKLTNKVGSVGNTAIKYTIKTSDYLGNITTDSDEIIVEGTTQLNISGGLG